MNKYNLLKQAQSGDNNAIEKIYNQYHKLIEYKISLYNISNKDQREELIIEAKLALHRVIKTYKNDLGLTAYIQKSIDNAIKNYIRKNNAKKNIIQNKTISIEQLPNKELEDKKYNPEYILEEEINYNSLRTKIINKLTWQEELVLTLKEQYFTTKEIAQIIDVKTSKIYQINTRIKYKILKICQQAMSN